MGVWCIFNYFVRQWEGTISWKHIFAVALNRNFLEELRIKCYLITDPFITSLALRFDCKCIFNIFCSLYLTHFLGVYDVAYFWEGKNVLLMYLLIFNHEKEAFIPSSSH